MIVFGCSDVIVCVSGSGKLFVFFLVIGVCNLIYCVILLFGVVLYFFVIVLNVVFCFSFVISVFILVGLVMVIMFV